MDKLLEVLNNYFFAGMSMTGKIPVHPHKSATFVRLSVAQALAAEAGLRGRDVWLHPLARGLWNFADREPSGIYAAFWPIDRGYFHNAKNRWMPRGGYFIDKHYREDVFAKLFQWDWENLPGPTYVPYTDRAPQPVDLPPGQVLKEAARHELRNTPEQVRDAWLEELAKGDKDDNVTVWVRDERGAPRSVDTNLPEWLREME